MRSVVVVTPATAPVVTLAEAKRDLRVDTRDDDARIYSLIWAAQNEIDGPDGWLGRAVSLRQYELRLNGFPCSCDEDIALPYPPLVVDDAHPLTVKYVDPSGVERTLDAAVYQISDDVAGVVNAGRRRLGLVYNQRWPSVRCHAEAVRIRYWAGYAAKDVRLSGIKSAICMHVRMHYESSADTDKENLRRAIDDVLRSYRIFDA